MGASSIAERSNTTARGASTTTVMGVITSDKVNITTSDKVIFITDKGFKTTARDANTSNQSTYATTTTKGAIVATQGTSENAMSGSASEVKFC